MVRRSSVSWVLALIAVVVALLAAGCAGSGGGASEGEVADLRSELADARQDSKYWQQLTSLTEPVELPSMTDHRAYMLPSGYLSPSTSTTWTSLRRRT
jgi:hypothetical protein